MGRWRRGRASGQAVGEGRARRKALVFPRPTHSWTSWHRSCCGMAHHRDRASSTVPARTKHGSGARLPHVMPRPLSPTPAAALTSFPASPPDAVTNGSIQTTFWWGNETMAQVRQGPGGVVRLGRRREAPWPRSAWQDAGRCPAERDDDEQARRHHRPVPLAQPASSLRIPLLRPPAPSPTRAVHWVSRAALPLHTGGLLPGGKRAERGDGHVCV